MKIEIDGKEYIEKTPEDGRDKNGNIDCHNSVFCNNSTHCDNSTNCYNSTSCYNSTGCHNSTLCDNSTGCHNSTACDNSTYCNNSTGCYNSTHCHNSTLCHNSTNCDNCAYCTYCDELVLEKFMIFNKKLENKDEYDKVKYEIVDKLGRFKHPKQLTKKDISWLKENIKQFDQDVLDRIIQNSMLPDNPKKEK